MAEIQRSPNIPPPGLQRPTIQRGYDDHERRVQELERPGPTTRQVMTDVLRFTLAGIVSASVISAPQMSSVGGKVTSMQAALALPSPAGDDVVSFRFLKNGVFVGPVFSIAEGAVLFAGSPGTLADVRLNEIFDRLQVQAITTTRAESLLVKVNVQAFGTVEQGVG